MWLAAVKNYQEPLTIVFTGSYVPTPQTMVPQYTGPPGYGPPRVDLYPTSTIMQVKLW